MVATPHASLSLQPLIQAVPAIRSRRGPRRRRRAELRLDKGHDYPHIHGMLRRRGIESSRRLGRHHWMIEPTLAWFTGYHGQGRF